MEFNESHLVSFGNYLLSQERAARVLAHDGFPERTLLVERIFTVSDADIQNWKAKYYTHDKQEEKVV